MLTINWKDKDAIIAVLVQKYKVPHGEIKLRYRQQLIQKLSIQELKGQIKILGGEDLCRSSDASELRSSLTSMVCTKKKGKCVINGM